MTKRLVLFKNFTKVESYGENCVINALREFLWFNV